MLLVLKGSGLTNVLDTADKTLNDYKNWFVRYLLFLFLDSPTNHISQSWPHRIRLPALIACFSTLKIRNVWSEKEHFLLKKKTISISEQKMRKETSIVFSWEVRDGVAKTSNQRVSILINMTTQDWWFSVTANDMLSCLSDVLWPKSVVAKLGGFLPGSKNSPENKGKKHKNFE